MFSIASGESSVIVRRRVLVIEHRKVHLVLIKMALRRLDEWVEARWVRDPEEALEAIGEDPEIDLILLSTACDGSTIRDALKTILPSWKDAPVVAVVCDALTPVLRRALEHHPVTVLAHPLRAGDLGALLREASGAPDGLAARQLRR